MFWFIFYYKLSLEILYFTEMEVKGGGGSGGVHLQSKWYFWFYIRFFISKTYIISDTFFLFRELLPKEISQNDLVNLTIDFFNSEPVICDKLDKISQEKVAFIIFILLQKNNKNSSWIIKWNIRIKWRNRSSRFLRVFTVSFLPFLATARGSNPARLIF